MFSRCASSLLKKREEPRDHAFGTGCIRSAFTLPELMIAMSIGMAVAAAALILNIYIYRGLSDTSSKIQSQRKADMIIEKITRGPMGTFGGIHSVYYNDQGTPGSPNPVIATIATAPTNQTFTFRAQTNFTAFGYISLTNYTDSSMAALYTIGYDTPSKTVYYRVNGGDQIPMVNGFPNTISMGRFMFTEPGTNAMVKLTFDLLVQKAGGRVLTNTYETTASYRNNPQE